MTHSLRLTASETNWRLFMIRKADPAFRAFRNKILERDHHTCQFCGFKAHEGMEIINLDGEYSNNKISNLATACPFCAQCSFLEAIGKSDFGGGTLICFPEMSQTELNGLCHVLFASMLGIGSYAKQAKSFYRSLRIRAQMVEEKFGEGMSNPALLGQLLLDTNLAEDSVLRREIDQKIRLLPSLPRYAPQIERWAKAAVDAMIY